MKLKVKYALIKHLFKGSDSAEKVVVKASKDIPKTLLCAL
jgi:hypothetical protein